jgi:hypothetical protein
MGYYRYALLIGTLFATTSLTLHLVDLKKIEILIWQGLRLFQEALKVNQLISLPTQQPQQLYLDTLVPYDCSEKRKDILDNPFAVCEVP